jgi:predicted secreted hydrolase
MRKPLRWPALASLGLVAIAGAAYGFLHLQREAPSPPVARGAADWTAALLELADEGFGRLPEDWRLELPKDHGAHPHARAETWAISAHLHEAAGADHAVQLALFRIALAGPDAPQAASAWVPREIYAGQLALLHGGAAMPSVERRLNRGVLGLAGHDAARGEIWLDDWSIAYGHGDRGAQVRLEATSGEVVVDLVLTPEKQALASAGEGAAAPFHGYAITRMSVEGHIGPAGDRRPVAGLAWLDHLWGDVPLPGGPIVWDRLQLQLDDGTDLAVVRSRRRDGGGPPTLAGFVVDATGAVDQIDAAALEMTATRTWPRGRADGAYPLDWVLVSDDLHLQVSPVTDDQRLDLGEPVWSGLIAAEGAFRGRLVSGFGTLQHTGYQMP